jgi:hypothetical protein
MVETHTQGLRIVEADIASLHECWEAATHPVAKVFFYARLREKRREQHLASHELMSLEGDLEDLIDRTHPCGGCVHWNGSRWGCELGTASFHLCDCGAE